MAQTAEELEAQKQAAEQQAQEQVDEAAREAQEQATQEGLSEDEVKDRVQKARKEEKDKLYPQIEALGNRVKEMQELLKNQQEDKEEEERVRNEEKERRRIAKLSDEEKQQEQLKNIEEQLKEEREARERLEADRLRDQQQREEEKRKANLDKYRETVLGLAGDEIIPELVYGDSEVEIDAAVNRAKEKYREIAEEGRKARGQQIRNDMSGSASPGTEALEEEELDQRLTQVDTDKYMKDEEYRDKIQGDLANAYARAQGRS